MSTTNLERAARIMCEVRANHPVVVIEGSRKAPEVLGHEAYYTTPGGKIIHHPNAYKYPKQYHCSTRRIEVGVDWNSPLRDLVVDGVDTVVVGEFRDFCGLRVAPAYLASGRDGWRRVWAIRDAETGRGFHGARPLMSSYGWVGLSNAMADARNVWAVRDANEREALALESLSDVVEPLVTREDSIAAGNCSEGTEAFASRRGWSSRYYVRADVLERSGEPRARLAVRAARKHLAALVSESAGAKS